MSLSDAARRFEKSEMHKWKTGKLHSGSKNGPIVKDQEQAVAIMLSQARKKGLKVGGNYA